MKLMNWLFALFMPLLRAGDLLFAPPRVVHAMTAATADVPTTTKLPQVIAYPVATATRIYKGTMVCLNAGGYAVPAADTSGFTNVMGLAFEDVNNAGGNGALSIRVQTNILALMAATSITQAMVGSTMYVTDDSTFDNTDLGDGIIAGILVGFVSTTQGWLLLREPLAAFGSTIGSGDIGAGAVTTTKLDDGAVTGLKVATQLFGLYTADGVDETMSAAITITPIGNNPAIVSTDEVIACQVLTTKASIASQALRDPADFTAGAGTITVGAHAANNTNNQYVFTVMHHV